jgi:response regulator of citrate/malate metabolism
MDPRKDFLCRMYQRRRTSLYMSVLLSTVNWNTAAALALYDAKEESRLTYEEIAETTGISVSSLKRYLAHKRGVTVEDFVAIARALGRDPIELFANVEARVNGHQ